MYTLSSETPTLLRATADFAPWGHLYSANLAAIGGSYVPINSAYRPHGRGRIQR